MYFVGHQELFTLLTVHEYILMRNLTIQTWYLKTIIEKSNILNR